MEVIIKTTMLNLYIFNVDPESFLLTKKGIRNVFSSGLYNSDSSV